MREILFRGKNEAGIWHYGAYLPYESGEVAILESFSKYGYEAVELSRRCKVIPETVGQYTGLTDKNGKKIFEGDIHKCGENLWLIAFGEFYDMDVTDYEYGWYCKKINSKHAEAFGFNGAESGYMNIIGNIHDNSKLLKGGENE